MTTSTTGPGSTGRDPALVDDDVFRRWLWTALHPYLGWVLIGLGLLFIGLGWWGVASHVVVAEQLPYLASGGLLGIAAIVLGGRFLTMHDLRRDSVRIERLEETVARLDTMVTQVHGLLLTRAPQPVPEQRPTGNGQAPGFVMLDNGAAFHRPDCQAVAGKTRVRTVGAADADVKGLRPCALCEPQREA